ncbi:acyl-ACP thioesterase domain-containing protein [uncultured Ruminococcus sp.]|uniref:acyl-[acyl-carrier-protein] thioesterase n=1 Tax=uncultured Ruminococcus sp. TaxID=165186 RepID=UPI0025E4710D|nr:acyl-ACP thioesterase domain-containing protein [uncultured Ruminococcus sp.]
MYEMNRRVLCSDIGENDEVRNGALIDILQDASNFHLETHPVMSPYFREENCGMFLVSRQMDIIRRPVYGENIHVKTWTVELKRMYGFRNTVIYGENGDVCIASSAGGAFMDLATQKPVRAPKELIDKVKVYPVLENFESCSRKIALPDCEPQVYKDVYIRRCDIDMNRHVNNARYVDITDEFIPENADVSRVRIEYKVPLKRGIKVNALVYTQGNIIAVSLADDSGKVYCVVEYTLNK